MTASVALGWHRLAAPFALLVTGLISAPSPDASAQDAADRTDRDGPYRSRMRIIDDAASPPNTPAPPASDFANALNARAQGYLAARDGDLDEAIRHLQTALTTQVLAPIAQRAVAKDVMALLAQAGRDGQLVATYSKWQDDGEPFDGITNMIAATAYERLGQFDLALRALDLALRDANASNDWRRFKVYLLARTQRFAEAATLAADILPLDSTDARAWRDLVELQRAAGQPHFAVATAELAFDRGILTSTADVSALATLYLATGLPDHAAVALVQHHARHPSDIASLTLLLRAQRGAGEIEDALITARARVELDATAEHLLAQAQFEHELNDPAAVAATLKRALRGDLGAQRGKALLLLGESLVATGETGAARRAFVQASELGGVYRDAQEWLARLDASRVDEPITSANDPTTVATVAPADAKNDARPGAAVEIQRLPRMSFFYASAQSALATLPADVAKLQRRVAIGLRRERLAAAGPLRWRVDGQALARGDVVALQLGVPVRTRVPPRGRFKNEDLPPMDAAVRRYRGDLSGLEQAWKDLIRDLIEAGHTPGGDARTVVVLAPRRGQNGEFELQLEVTGTP